MIFYILTKAAVKNGILEANQVMAGTKVKAGAIDVKDNLREGDIRTCKRCGSFKKLDAFCHNCASMGTGKKVSMDTWEALKKTATEQEESIKTLLNEMAICTECNTLKKIDAVCPNCGAEPYQKKKK